MDDFDDPSSYTTDRFETLTRVEEALEIFEHADRKYPIVYGDGERAEAWLVHAPFYDQMARALDWVRADEAATADPGDPELRAAYEAAADSALHVDRPGEVLARLPTLTPERFVAAVPELVEQIRSGTLAPTAVGRHGTPQAVLVRHEDYRDLVQAHMRWHQSPPFLATLDPSVHKPMAKSRPLDLDEFMSQDPVSREIWERIKHEEDDDDE
jgi:hypothetical protein